jgi:hypothetical protein
MCTCKICINFISQHPECTERCHDGDDDDRDLSDTDDGSDQPFMVSISLFSLLEKVLASKYGKVVIKTEYTNEYAL